MAASDKRRVAAASFSSEGDERLPFGAFRFLPGDFTGLGTEAGSLLAVGLQDTQLDPNIK